MGRDISQIKNLACWKKKISRYANCLRSNFTVGVCVCVGGGGGGGGSRLGAGAGPGVRLLKQIELGTELTFITLWADSPEDK